MKPLSLSLLISTIRQKLHGQAAFGAATAVLSMGCNNCVHMPSTEVVKSCTSAFTAGPEWLRSQHYLGACPHYMRLYFLTKLSGPRRRRPYHGQEQRQVSADLIWAGNCLGLLAENRLDHLRISFIPTIDLPDLLVVSSRPLQLSHACRLSVP